MKKTTLSTRNKTLIYLSEKANQGFLKMKSYGKTALVAAFFITTLLTSHEALATHYRYGNISWSRADGATRTVKFTTSMAYRKSFFGAVGVGNTVNVGNFNFGDGTTVPLQLTITSVNIAEDWFYGTFTTTKTYGGAATSFTASYASNARLSSLQNNKDAQFGSQTVVNFVSGNTGSPVSTMPPIINLAVNNPGASFIIPALDPDGSALNFSLATAIEVGGGGPFVQPAGLSVNSTSGLASFSTVGKVVGQLFSAAITIRDANGSKTIVDFIIKIVPTSNVPVFDYAVTPTNSFAYSLSPGQALNFNVRATDSDAGDIVTLSAVGLSAGMNFSPALPTSGNPVLSAFSWTPSNTDLGIHIINFTAQDITGTQAQTSVIINVNINPIFIAPTPALNSERDVLTGTSVTDIISATNPDPLVNTSLFSASLPAGATLSASLPTALTSTPSVTMDWTPTPANFGVNTLSYVAKDANNRTATHSYTLIANTIPYFTSTPVTSAIVNQPYSYVITVTDDDLPYGDVLDIHLNYPGTIPTWLTYVDNHDGTATLSGTPTLADLGTYDVELVAEDTYHHSHAHVDQHFHINVIGVPPVITCNQNITVNTDAGTCGAVVNFTASATGIPTPNLTYSSASGSIFNTGTTQVVVYANNGVGVDSCVFNVTVIDNENPVITCATGINIDTDLDLCGSNSVQLGKPSVSDNCGIASVTNNAPSTYSVGTTIVTWTATDVNGNVSNCDQTVIVTDNQAPTVLTNNITVNLDATGNAVITVSQIDNGSSDNCGIASLVLDNTNFTCANVGDNTVTLTATDVNGNVSSNTAVVTVVDAIAPVVLTNNVTVNLDATGNAVITVAQIDNGSSDACGIASLTLDNTNFICANVGDNTVALTATDVNGNVSSNTAVVTVVDAIAPVVLTNNVTVNLDATGNGAITVAQIDNGSSDACGIANLDLDKTTFDCSNVGTNIVTLTATDVNGNVSSNTAIVTVVDGIAPTITCGGDINIVADRNDCTPIVNWTAPTASDNCSYVVTSNYQSGDRFPVGTTAVVYTATDASGNQSSCSFNVTISANPLVGSIVAKTYVGGKNISCYGKNDGEATVTVEGGCLPYSYEWNSTPVQTGATATNLVAGTYEVKVTDANNQVITLTITLTQPSELLANAGNNATVYFGYTPNSCAMLNGSATGGTTNYSYSWSNGSSSLNTQVCPSTSTDYTFTVTDANGCISKDVVRVCATDVRCEKGGNAIVYYEGGKVVVCHIPNGDVSKRHVICIAPSAVPDHLAHGDVLGVCGANTNCYDAVTKSSESLENGNIDLSAHVIAFPNPFSNKTTIEFNVGESSRTFIEIYDLKGSLINKAFDGPTMDGQVNRIEIDGANWDNGIYIAKIVNQNTVQYIKLLLTK